MQHSFVSSFLIVEENQKSEPSPLSRKGSDFYYSVRITGLERLAVTFKRYYPHIQPDNTSFFVKENP